MRRKAKAGMVWARDEETLTDRTVRICYEAKMPRQIGRGTKRTKVRCSEGRPPKKIIRTGVLDVIKTGMGAKHPDTNSGII